MMASDLCMVCGMEVSSGALMAHVQAEHGVKVIAEQDLPDGKWVSTVRLAFGDGFETMVFAAKGPRNPEVDAERYDSEAEALEGHRAMVAKWKQGEG